MFTSLHNRNLIHKFPFLFCVSPNWHLNCKKLITIKNVKVPKETKAMVKIEEPTVTGSRPAPRLWIISENDHFVGVSEFNDKYPIGNGIWEYCFTPGLKISLHLDKANTFQTTHIVIKTDDDCYIIYKFKY